MKLFNTLTKKKEEFNTIEKNKVRMYACGPTVYDLFHIGNARTFLVFDALRKYLEFRGYEVNFIQNFTDIDDKIINKANNEGVSSKEISEKYIKEYFKDAESLGIDKADFHPKVSENINEIIDIIRILESKGYAYEIDGDVYFNTKEYEAYGKLINQDLEDLKSGARVEINNKKENQLDFVLWKKAKENEPSWNSPWGDGRPGWHIECSAMAKKYLGETIDIHGGGGDLIFPHHENEVAQSEAASGKKFANYWVHVGYLNIENKKMSKSLNNFFTIRDIQKEFDLEVLRLFFLSSHYRSPINFSKELLDSNKKSLERLYTGKDYLNNLIEYKSKIEIVKENDNVDEKLILELENFKSKFIESVDDDFNTAEGIAILFDLLKFLNTNINHESSLKSIELAKNYYLEIASVFGLLKSENKKELGSEEIENLIEERNEARKNKDYKKADEIREKLLDMDIELKDTKTGVQWKRIKNK